MAAAPLVYQIHAIIGLGDLGAVAVQPPRARVEHPRPVHRPAIHPLPPPLLDRTLMDRWRPNAGLVKRTLDAIPPASGAVVMGTGIVSIALSLDGHETLSRILLVLDAVMWAALTVLLPARATRDRARFLADARTPAALTSVAGSAVLGTRLTVLGWDWAGVALLVIALVLWAALLAPVLGNWKTPTVGASLVLTVSTESLAVLAATLAIREHARWLLFVALAPFVLGLCLLRVRDLPLRPPPARSRPWRPLDHRRRARDLDARRREDHGRRESTRDPRRRGRDAEGPVGRTLGTDDPVAARAAARRGAASPAAVRRASLVDRVPAWDVRRVQLRRRTCRARGAITSFARGWVWVALAVWAVVLLALIRRAIEVVRGDGTPNPAAVDELGASERTAV